MKKREEPLELDGHPKNAMNLAFDITPGELVTSRILDSGVYDTAALRDRVLLKLKK